jgi:RimJ/RimL family protein N-acetyltransferase
METPTATEPDIRTSLAITIRPLEEADRAALLRFGACLPQEDWLYLENNFQSPETISMLINARNAEHWRQIVAVAEDGEIMAYSSARLLPGWSSHVANIQLIVGERWRRQGIGTAIGREICQSAQTLGADKVIVKILAPRIAGTAIFKRLGFIEEGRLIRHARDRDGQYQDMVILSYHV